MRKRKIVTILCFIFLLAGCYNVNQKVTKLTASNDLIKAMEQDGYLTKYDAIEAVAIDERIAIEERMEIFIQHAFLVQGLEVDISEEEQKQVEKQDQLLLLYAIHNPNKKTAIDVSASLNLPSQLIFSETSDRSFEIDMCEIKPGLFCKLRQPPYTTHVAIQLLNKEIVDRFLEKDNEVIVDFQYVTAESGAELFAQQIKGYPSNRLKTKSKSLSLRF